MGKNCLHLAYMEVDGLGVAVEYNSEKDLSPEVIRRHLIGTEHTSCVVEAKTLEEAVRIFYKDWEGAKIGGMAKSDKALRISENKPIIGLPFCPFMHVTEEGTFICGEKIPEEECGERGLCILEPFIDPPDEECPMDKLSIIESKIRTVAVDGEKYLFFDSNGK